MAYCSGFFDKHGQWNNGFHCRKWSSKPGFSFCCGTPTKKFCCREPRGTTTAASERRKLTSRKQAEVNPSSGSRIGVLHNYSEAFETSSTRFSISVTISPGPEEPPSGERSVLWPVISASSVVTLLLLLVLIIYFRRKRSRGTMTASTFCLPWTRNQFKLSPFAQRGNEFQKLESEPSLSSGWDSLERPKHTDGTEHRGTVSGPASDTLASQLVLHENLQQMNDVEETSNGDFYYVSVV